MLSLTLILLLAVEAQKNRAPVCAIGLKKGARVRLPGGARKASPALQIRVRKQLPKKIAKTFPSFDERIGWSIHGVYDDEGLPAEVEERLSRFFRPHDDAFFEILGRRLAWRN